MCQANMHDIVGSMPSNLKQTNNEMPAFLQTKQGSQKSSSFWNYKLLLKNASVSAVGV